MVPTEGETWFLDEHANVIQGLAYTPDSTAIILDDGRVFTEDTFAVQDQATGNILTILDPLENTNYSVVTEVIEKDGKFFTYDPTSFAGTLGN